MIKGLIIVTIAFYVFYKVSSFFFKAGAASQQLRQQQSNRHAKNDGRKSKDKNNMKGGEYVDYEEVK